MEIKRGAVLRMFWSKTSATIIETSTIVKGLKEDFIVHSDHNREDIDGLYKVIKECHGSCPEKDRFDGYITEANGTLKRIEEKYDDYHKAADVAKIAVAKRQDDYLAKLQTIKDEVSGITQAKTTIRRTWADAGKVLGYIVIVSGLAFGIIRYCDSQKTKQAVHIEALLKEILKEQRIGKG